MKKMLIALFALFAVSASQVHAAPLSASFAGMAYASTNLTTSAYVQLIASLTKSIKGVSVYNTGANAVFLAVGASGQESNQIIISPMTAGTPAVYIPLVVSQSQRISVIASTGTISSGVLNLNFLYN